jgi:hypothetical protein
MTMGKRDPLQQITTLYHFTDRRNIPMIRRLGGLFPLAQLRKAGHKVPHPGGNQWSHDADAMKGLDAYVHLCFRDNHPMEHQARQNGHIGEAIFLQVHPDVLNWSGVQFTPDVSNKSGVDAFSIEQARGMIDYEVLYTRTNWNDPTVQERLQQAEKCEILVPRKIPLEMIRNLPNG